jgi:murein DD-endopeptidase MepM/ murein hydrolase activator NlpD
MTSWIGRGLALAFLALMARTGATAPFELPTVNRAVLDPDGGGERFFVGTEGKPWMSGQFGCVRTDGGQFHEGTDIRPITRDRHGEPADIAMAAADGVVAYINVRPGLSAYGNYVVIRHKIDGIEIFTLYGHLAKAQPGLKPGDSVRAGQPVGLMGHTSNTRQRITLSRAHLHFEIDMLASEHYATWHRARMPTTRNDHGNFNGFNLLGLDPAAVFHEQRRLGSAFRFGEFLRQQPALCVVRVRTPDFSWVRRYRELADSNPRAQREGIAAWDLTLTFNGLPCRMIPRSAGELRNGPRVELLLVDPAVHDSAPCGHVVVRRGTGWALTGHGQQLMDMLTY